MSTGLDFFLSGRSLPAWITGLAFIAANLGALEILGLAANGAKYGIATVHFYWIGAVPAMVFLGIVMMPFYYNSKVRSVPEYLRLRFNDPTHVLNSLSFAVATVLIAGVNLFAMALVIRLLLGWPLALSIVLAAGIVLVYITLGACPQRSTTRCCSSSSSWPGWCRSPSSGSRRSAAGAGCRTR
jgi:solute:Na+ symporter, SSS family